MTRTMLYSNIIIIAALLAFGTHFAIAVGTGPCLCKQRCSLSQRFGLFIVYFTIILFIIAEQT